VPIEWKGDQRPPNESARQKKSVSVGPKGGTRPGGGGFGIFSLAKLLFLALKKLHI